MNAKISLFAICVEAIIYLLYNLYDCTFNWQEWSEVTLIEIDLSWKFF